MFVAGPSTRFFRRRGYAVQGTTAIWWPWWSDAAEDDRKRLATSVLRLGLPAVVSRQICRHSSGTMVARR
ncbi:hypothetical protein PC116_g28159 [Phytophthora cactorum]|nr:hypothetical protein PC116_g28159 [Phytophthora cactorum]